MSLTKPQELLDKFSELDNKVSIIEKHLETDSKNYESQQKQINLLKEKVTNQKKTLNWQQGFIIAILIVVFVSFVGFIIDASRFHGNKAEQYQETIEKLRKENIELKIQNKVDSYLKEQKQNKNKPEKTEQ